MANNFIFQEIWVVEFTADIKNKTGSRITWDPVSRRSRRAYLPNCFGMLFDSAVLRQLGTYLWST
jgi:hypothetical protein